MKSVISILLLVTCSITYTASINQSNTHSRCSFTVESNNYTHAVMIVPVQHGFTVTLKPIDANGDSYHGTE